MKTESSVVNRSSQPTASSQPGLNLGKAPVPQVPAWHKHTQMCLLLVWAWGSWVTPGQSWLQGRGQGWAPPLDQAAQSSWPHGLPCPVLNSPTPLSPHRSGSRTDEPNGASGSGLARCSRSGPTSPLPMSCLYSPVLRTMPRWAHLLPKSICLSVHHCPAPGAPEAMLCYWGSSPALRLGCRSVGLCHWAAKAQQLFRWAPCSAPLSPIGSQLPQQPPSPVGLQIHCALCFPNIP